ncbi:MAG: hypothetical protein ABL974_16060, partial [Prosthecobacter sp.]
MSEHGNANALDWLLEPSIQGIGPLQAWKDTPFVLLLGRPGAGKSRELVLADKHGWLGDSLRVEVADIASAPGVALDDLLVGKNTASGTFRLILDGLDEALLLNPRFVQQLRRWFGTRLGPDGKPALRLALSCRWADWPAPAVSELASLWQLNEFPRLILCPLRRSDVVATLQCRFGSEADKFSQQMQDQQLAGIACWPQAMRELLDEFSQTRQLATSHGKIISDQVNRHCRLADSPDDTLRWEKSSTDPEWRQRVAGRLAACMIWSGKPALHIGAAMAADSSLTTTDLAHTDELWHGQRKPVQLADLDAIIHHTRLMKRLGEGPAWRFASQVHQEWLAADWIAFQQLDEKRLRLLFGTTQEGGWAVFPPLASVAAWLAQMQSEFRQMLLRDDPLVLLRLDAATLSEKDRHDIVEALLQRTQQAEVLDPGVRQAHFPSLKHAQLESQLCGWLEAPDMHDVTKTLALEIAKKCHLTGLAAFLWKLYPHASKRLKIDLAGGLLRLAREGFDDQWRKVLSRD